MLISYGNVLFDDVTGDAWEDVEDSNDQEGFEDYCDRDPYWYDYDEDEFIDSRGIRE